MFRKKKADIPTSKPVVFIDTNIVNNPTPTGGLFGSSERLKCFDERVLIIIAEIVYQELIEHKRRAHNTSKDRLLNNVLFPQLEQIIPRKKAEELLEFCEPCVLFDEEVAFERIQISNYKKFCEWAFELALQNKAPFDNSSDKGFKDAALAYTIEEYLQNNSKKIKQVVLVSNDGRLGEYFQGREDVVWHKGLEELEGWLNELPEKTSEAYNTTETAIEKLDNTKCEEVAKGSIAPTPQLVKARQLLTALRNSGNFATTHNIIAELSPYTKYLTENDFVDILLSALNNEQIMWISGDTDVINFLQPIFDKHKDKLTIQQYNDFVNRTGWPNYRIKEPVEVSDLSDIPF